MITLFARRATRALSLDVPIRSLLLCKPTCSYVLSFTRSVSKFRYPHLTALHNRLSVLNKPRRFQHDFAPPDQNAVMALKVASCDPLRVWETSVNNGKATVSTAVLCVSAYLRALQGLTRDEIKENVKAEKLGKKMLLWLWSPDNVSTAIFHQRIRDFSDSHAFQYELCYLLIEEGEEEYLWSWMAVDAGDIDKEGVSGKFFTLWRGFLLRNLIAAKLDQAIAYGTHSADEAISALWRAVALRKAKHHEHSPRHDLLARMSLLPASMSLVSRLGTPAFQNTSPEQWDSFRTFVQRPRGTSLAFASWIDRSRLDCAKLDLFRPKDPDATIALELIKEFTEVPATMENLHKTSPEATRWFKTMLSNVIHLLKKDGKLAEAAEIEDLLRRLDKEWGAKPGGSPARGRGVVSVNHRESCATSAKQQSRW